MKGTIEVDTILLEKIKENNNEILSALQEYDGYSYPKWGIVEPPLARTLSKPAMEYQKAMISKHKPTMKNIDLVIKAINQ